MKQIQLFMAPYQDNTDRVEINGELVSISHKDGWTTVKWREEGTKAVDETRFPDWNISMIRIWKS